MLFKRIAVCAFLITFLSRADHANTQFFISGTQLLADNISLSFAKTVITGYLSFIYGGVVISDVERTLIAQKHPKLKDSVNLMNSKNKWICGGTYAGILALTQYVDENSPASAQYAVKAGASLLLAGSAYFAFPPLLRSLKTHAQTFYGDIKTKIYGTTPLPAQ